MAAMHSEDQDFLFGDSNIRFRVVYAIFYYTIASTSMSVCHTDFFEGMKAIHDFSD